MNNATPRNILLLTALALPAALFVAHACSSKNTVIPADESEEVTQTEPLETEEASEGIGAAIRAAIASQPPPPPPPPQCALGVPDGSGGCIVTPADRRAAMTPEEKWTHVLTECPSEDVGPMVDIWTWTPTETEVALLGLDLDGTGTILRSMADFEGTSIIIKVKDAATEENKAVIKTTSSNTRIDGEIYAHRLSVFLGFGELVADVAPLRFGAGALDKTATLLRGIDLDDVNKAANRDRVLRQVEAARQGGDPFDGAMKPWLRGFMFHSTLGHRESLATAEVMRYLKARGAQAPDNWTTLRQTTRLYDPQGTYEGTIQMSQLAQDLSNILLMDALIGQNDRFPGGNLHFMSVAGTVTESGQNRRGDPNFLLGEVRLLALDNGAAMKSATGSGINDLQGNVIAGTRVERFERESIDRLKALARRTIGHGCALPPHPEEAAAIWTYLGLAPDQHETAVNYLRAVMEYIDELETRQGESLFLAPVNAVDPNTAALVLEANDGAAENP